MAIISRSIDKAASTAQRIDVLSIREHEEFRNSIKSDIAQLRIDYKRDDDRLEERIKVLEATRPTTGELEAKLQGSDK